MSMPANLVRLLIIALVAIILLGSSIAIVPETKQAVIVRFGEPVRIVNAYQKDERFGTTGAGINVRVPLAEQIVWIDKRVQSVEMERQQVLSTDQLRLQVDAFALYRIIDPLRMYIAAGSESRVEDALRPILGSALRNELGKVQFAALLTPERSDVMHNIARSLNRVAAQYGAQIIDVRIKRADLPNGTPLDSAFQRMATARKQEALTIRAEGEKQAQIIGAEADARAAQIYAASFGKDPGFYDFYRAMQAYRRTFDKANGQTSIILSPNSDFMRQFEGRK